MDKIKDTRIWVKDKFKNNLKSEAAQRGISMLKLTEDLSMNALDDLMNKPRKRRGDKHLFRI